jgi:hypothetical protein
MMFIAQNEHDVSSQPYYLSSKSTMEGGVLRPIDKKTISPGNKKSHILTA